MYGRTGRETWRALLALGADPTPEQVVSVIGNRSWTDTPRCNGCGRYGEERVVGLEAPGDDDDTGGVTYLCAECVGACAELLGSKR